MLPLYKEEMSAEVAWQRYSQLTDFDRVVFPQFKEKLAYHRKATLKKIDKASREAAALTHDRSLYPPPPPKDATMERARKLLRDDIQCETDHNRKLCKIRQQRSEYRMMEERMGKQKFKECIYYERKRKKFINYRKSKEEEDPYQPPGADTVTRKRHREGDGDVRLGSKVVRKRVR